MLPYTTGGASFTVALADEQATVGCGRHRRRARARRLVTLSGDLGAGKTTFARAHDPPSRRRRTIEVPSPTFTLMQTYELPRFPVVHADLYRVTAPASSPNSASTTAEGRRGAAGMAGPRRRLPAGGPPRHRASRCAEARARTPRRRDHRLRRIRARASSASPTIRHFLANGYGDGRARGASRATPRPAPTSGCARRAAAPS